MKVTDERKKQIWDYHERWGWYRLWYSVTVPNTATAADEAKAEIEKYGMTVRHKGRSTSTRKWVSHVPGKPDTLTIELYVSEPGKVPPQNAILWTVPQDWKTKAAKRMAGEK